jgi:hypothetical protein
MKTFRKILVLASLLLSAGVSYSQKDNLLTELPDSTKEAFMKSEPQVINTINWLNNTPVDKDVTFRKKQMMLLTAWIINSPTVTIEYTSATTPFTKKNPVLLVTFMGGWTKYSLENNYSADKIKCNLSAVKSVIEFYKKGSGLKMDKEVDNLVKLSDSELEAWVTKKLNEK